MAQNRALSLVLLAAIAVATGAAEYSPSRAKPYLRLGDRAYEYTGPADPVPPGGETQSIPIGIFVPTTGSRAEAGRSLLRGARLAIREINAGGGIDGQPIELIIGRDDTVWGSANEIVRLAYQERVVAIAGAIGGQSTHIAEQIATKARLPLLGVATSDASLTAINIPWMFRLPPTDTAMARLLGHHISSERGLHRAALIYSQDYDHRLGASAFRSWANDHRLQLVVERSLAAFDSTDDILDGLDREPAIDALVLWCGAEQGAEILAGLQRNDLHIPVFGGPGLANPDLLAPDSQRLTVVAPCNPWIDDSVAHEFATRLGTTPDIVAAYAYDGMRILIQAIERAGPSRAGIRDALAQSSFSEGMTGRIDFDNTGANTTRPVLISYR